MILDAGALIAVDRGDRDVLGVIALGRRAGLAATVAPVVSQVWRDGARQARLARLLAVLDVRSVHDGDARRAGELLAAAGTADAVDALVVAAARPGDTIVTSDPVDIRHLVDAGDRAVTVVAV